MSADPSPTIPEHHLLLVTPFGIPEHMDSDDWDQSEAVHRCSPPPETWSLALILTRRRLHEMIGIARWLKARPGTDMVSEFGEAKLSLKSDWSRLISPRDDKDAERLRGSPIECGYPSNGWAAYLPGSPGLRLRATAEFEWNDETQMHTHYCEAVMQMPLAQLDALFDQAAAQRAKGPAHDCVRIGQLRPEGEHRADAIGVGQCLGAIPQVMRPLQMFSAREADDLSGPLWATVPGPPDNALALAQYIGAHMPDERQNLRAPFTHAHRAADAALAAADGAQPEEAMGL